MDTPRYLTLTEAVAAAKEAARRLSAVYVPIYDSGDRS